MADINLVKQRIRFGDGFCIVERKEAGETLSLGDTVVLLSDSTIVKTRNATDGIYGIVVSCENKSVSGSAGEFFGVAVFGHVVGFTTLTPGALYYLSAEAGTIADSGTIAIGYARDAETLFVMPAVADIPY